MDLTLTPKQTLFFDSILDDDLKVRSDNPFTEFYFFGGFGSGKSRIVSSIVNILCLQYPNCHGVYIRGTFPELKDSVIPQYLSYFPCNENGYKYNKSERTIEYDNGTRLDFRAFDKDTKILSNEYDFIVFSQLEEIQQDLFLQSLGRNRRKVGGMPKNLLLAEGNPAAGWVKVRLKDNALKSNMCLVEAKTKENPFLPPDYEPNLRANYPDFWIARYLDGEWTNLDEMVFSEFRTTQHIINPIGYDFIKSYKQRAGLDYGWVNPSAIVWAFTDYDGNLTIFDEWGDSQKTMLEIAKEAKRYGKLPIIADYSIKGNRKDGRSLWDDLSAEGLNLFESNKDELTNITLVNALLKQGRLKITKNCACLLREIENYKWKKIKLGSLSNQPEEPVQKDNHYIDAMLYLIASIEELKTPDPKVKSFKNSLLYRTQRHDVNLNNLA